MDRPRLIRGLRIAWTAVCGIVCLLLTVLWIASYGDLGPTAPYPIIGTKQLTIELYRGRIAIILSLIGEVLMLPFWLPILLGIAAGAAPWFKYRFSLRTLLIATTLIAVVLGFIVYVTRS